MTPKICRTIMCLIIINIQVEKTVPLDDPPIIGHLFSPRDYGRTQYDLEQTGQSELDWIENNLDDPEENATHREINEIWRKMGCESAGFMGYIQLCKLIPSNLHERMNAWFTDNYNGVQQTIGKEAFTLVMSHTLNHQQIKTIKCEMP